jgi:hypothetical protein
MVLVRAPRPLVLKWTTKLGFEGEGFKLTHNMVRPDAGGRFS